MKVRNISSKLIGIENKQVFPGEEAVVSVVTDSLRCLASLKMVEIIEDKKPAKKEVVVEKADEPEEAEEPAAEVKKTAAKRTTKKKA